LIEHGHERIGIIRPPLDWASTRDCTRGYQRALEEAGIEVNDSLHARTSGYTIEAGFEAANALISTPVHPTALYAVSDLLAIGAMQAIKARGMRIPHDIAVVGYNDIEIASIVDPPLTTVSASARKLGKEAMNMLQRLIRGEDVTQSPVVIETKLVVRSSCGFH
jgi:DNA-binding LacI/PurR family transcriptional regulator